MASEDYRPEERPNNHLSVFPWPGGKGRESDWLIDRMPPHTCYVEVFGGSGALLYNKPASSNEVYNDVNDDLVQFFNVLRERDEELVEWLRQVPYSRYIYDEWVDEYLDGFRPDDPVERAGRFYTLRFMAFGGHDRKRSGFKARNKKSPAITFDNARERLSAVADRFRRVIIESKDYSDLLADYDGEEVLFYCDPPYVGTEGYYGIDFDHSAFVEALRGLEADWMVSYADLPAALVAEMVGQARADDLRWHVLSRERRHRMTGGGVDVTERLICNFDPSTRSSFVDVDTEQARLGSVAAQGGDGE